MTTSFQDRFKANVLCGLVGDHLIGSHIFDQSLNADRYVNSLQNDFLWWMENFDLAFRKNLTLINFSRTNCEWWRISAHPHWFRCAIRQYNRRTVRLVLTRRCKDPYIWLVDDVYLRIFRRESDFLLVHGLDVSTADFFLWGFLRDVVYENQPTTLVELKAEIKMAIRSADENMLQNVFKNLLRPTNEHMLRY